MSTRTIDFASGGVRLKGDLHLPDDATAPVPAVVYGPGFGGVKEMLIPSYAKALNRAGIAVLAFDYAGFGSSEGQPRQHLDLDAQQQGYRDALDYLIACPGIAPGRLGVFGTSMSGGHALAVAATDARVRSTVVLIPFTGLDVSAQPAELLTAAEEAATRMASGEPPQMIANSGKPGELAAMNSDGAWEWVGRMAADAPTFRNVVTLASLWNVANYHPATDVFDISTPVHAVLAVDDGITPAAAARKALEPISGVEIVEFPQTHFEFFDHHLHETVDLTTQWFTADLLSR
ncbi:alpha/beta fold hydrolase [Amycolatopsis sp. K13G38]|uniref:Alpha/beta fold hydrolase n=1 Tax=Amycolatopsis acididurans TaxID=2724524 RepID=A0ABX1J417_9PSEU|nr:alpha/beta fold hydrolase [Amycolatopsis acididurans]NKQ54404.1 alpha/beta fold hydrolase [Amycolatopsis acididurans]